LFLLFLSVFQLSFAQVPDHASTFTTNIKFVSATTSQQVKVEAAAALIRQVLATEEFREKVINHKYGSKYTYVDNAGLTNSQVYEKILDGAETLRPAKNNAMDLEVAFYYENSNTVGYTTTGSMRIYMNTKYFNTYTPAQVARNLMHEWLHKIGFKHAVNYSTSRDSSIPYAIGEIVQDLALDLPDGGPTAPGSVAVVKSGTGVKVSWTAASSDAGITSYKVYRRLSGSTTNYLQTTTTALSYTQSSPTKAATYYVRAYDRNGDSAKSVEVRFTK
jgi:hypothetical protein